ncbi:hypothetical protein ABE65_005265 [Fictibacillus phosphorivorans]|jgi:peptidoglycan/LPS O-acetylase OafA/YrhL|uniref:Uncharacterized protein n=1 Tax=Fictibacillus phosphorivorans TaxID=1221500 RepID=A0A168VUJ5_9BACL|nr:hypothetical protein [Fictibacillus phosphorivorans]ANC76249.1 hypothetical protein ABE65_005265 [Fictibacillus phosphorivorans]
MIELIRIGLVMILTCQGSYFILLILLYGTMMHWYEWGTFPKPSNIFEKTVNFLTALVFGVAYWAGLKVKKQKWFIRPLYLLGYLFIYIILAIITYKLLNSILTYIEMNI